MNIEAYIASGVLELYVLGELTPTENAEVEENAARYPEIQQELDRIQEAFQQLAFRSAVPPQAALKNKILAQITSTTESHHSSATKPVTPRQPSKTVAMLRYGMAASVAVAIAATLAALYFRSQWKDTEQLLVSLQAQNQQIAQQYETTNRELQQLSQDFSVVSNPDFRIIRMNGLDPAPDSEALVYWNPDSRQVYLKVTDMPANNQNQQYQLWAIADGQPVSAGVFDVTDQEMLQLLEMQAVGEASAFAVTLEPRGGSESPTLDAMYVMGEVASS